MYTALLPPGVNSFAVKYIIPHLINSGNCLIDLVPTENNTRISASFVVKNRFTCSYLLNSLSEISITDINYRGTLRRRYEICISSSRSLKAHGILFASALPTSLINLYTLFKRCNLIFETL